MKVLYISYSCDPDRGSEPAIGWNWPYHAALRGHQVWALTRPAGAEARAAVVRRNPGMALRFVEIPTPAWTARFLPSELRTYIDYARWLDCAVAAAGELTTHENIDVIHHVSWGSYFWGSPFHSLGPPLIFGPIGGGQTSPGSFHDYFGHSWWKERLRNFLLANMPVVRKTTLKTIRKAAVVVASNTDTDRLVRKLHPSQTAIVPDFACFGVNTVLRRSPRGDALRLLWVGRILPRKGLRLALDIVQHLSRKTPVTLTILGDGPWARKLPGWIAVRQLESRVNYRGKVPYSEVAAAYLEHDCLLFTSLRDSLGGQVVEALSAGLPVATLRHHGAGDLIDDSCGVGVPVSTPEKTILEFSAALGSLASSPARLSALSEGARRKAARHTWAQRAAWAEGLYESVLATTPGNSGGMPGE